MLFASYLYHFVENVHFITSMRLQEMDEPLGGSVVCILPHRILQWINVCVYVYYAWK